MRQKKSNSNKPITEKQRRFVEAYMGEAAGNASEAARLAGYKSPRQEGSRLLTKADIKAEIANLRKAESHQAALTRQEKKRLLAEIARDSSKKNRWNAMKAIDIDNRMDGFYVQKHEMTARVMHQPLGELCEETAESLRQLGATVIPPPDGWPDSLPDGGEG